MKRGAHLLLGLAVGFAALPGQTSDAAAQPLTAYPLIHTATPPQGRNTISGHVFSNSRSPVPDVYVELLNDLNVNLNRTKTNGSGFYTFRNLTDGRYRVRVLPYGTDYMEQVQEIQLYSISMLPGAGADTQQVDFYLKVNANANAGPFAAPPGTVFAQEVPEEAKKLYEAGVKVLRDKNEKEGFQSLKRALEIFPDYYLALDRLGTEYVVRGYFEAAYILLTKATEVNSRSYSSTFGLGLAQYHLKRTDEAVETLQRAVTLFNKSINGYLWLGMALKRAGKLDQAEASFKRANELGKGKVADVHWQLAGLYGEQKRYREAADSLELFLKNRPDARDAEKIRQVIKQLREKAGSA